VHKPAVKRYFWESFMAISIFKIYFIFDLLKVLWVFTFGVP